MLGGRGMERLLSNTVRNYLPPSWAEIEAVLNQRSNQYGALAAELDALVQAHAVLTPEQTARFSEPDREDLDASRRAAALLQVTGRRALVTSSERFSNLQQLINAIASASDQKAILDLQARIAVEQGMLANEQTKLYVLYQAAQAEELARRQRIREQAIAAIGSLRRLPPIGL
jgi:type IV secretion system protein VirB5